MTLIEIRARPILAQVVGIDENRVASIGSVIDRVAVGIREAGCKRSACPSQRDLHSMVVRIGHILQREYSSQTWVRTRQRIDIRDERRSARRLQMHIRRILRRHDRIVAPPGGERAVLRFEKPAPNVLWQMDFKGWVRLADGKPCHPLTIVDDHSRYVPCLKACADEQAITVQNHLRTTFQNYGLPDALFVDNGGPWGDASGTRWTRLVVWLLKLGVEVWHSRPYHPQSRGKNERFHRTLKDEVFELRRFRDLADVQHAFDRWREVYNFERPHEALGQDVPASRYQPSTRPMPERLPTVDYDASEIVRRVGTTKAYISFKGKLWPVPQAFCGERVALRPLSADGRYGIYFGAHQIAEVDLTKPKSVGDVPEHPSVMSPG